MHHFFNSKVYTVNEGVSLSNPIGLFQSQQKIELEQSLA